MPKPNQDTEELRLHIAHLREEMASAVKYARNCIRANSSDIEDWQASMKILADRLESRLGI